MGYRSRFYVDIMNLHNEVTGSCHLVSVRFPNDEKLKFVVDCGLFQEEGGEDYNKSLTFNPEEISFCLITHAHVDHIGRLPLMVKQGFYSEIYATETTCEIMPIALADTFSILKGNSKNKGTASLYEEEDVQRIIRLQVPCKYEEKIRVHSNVNVYFFRNAHIPGAASILVNIHYPECEDINLLFSGDYNNKSSFQEDSFIPNWVFKLPLTVVCESTYGDVYSTDIVPCFDKNLLEAIDKEKTFLALVFSLARTQEVLYRLKCLQDSGKLDKNIPIYLDGKLAIKYTKMYAKGTLDIKPEMIDFLPENLSFVDKIVRKSLIHEDSSCKIILTSSGMGTYGPARSYIPEYLGRENVVIHFTGFTAEGTLGRKLKDAPDNSVVTALGMMVKKRAKVEYTSEFSSHAKVDVLLDFLKQFKHLNMVLINHGESHIKEHFAEVVLNNVETKRVGILNREVLFRVDSWNLIKTIPTKFI